MKKTNTYLFFKKGQEPEGLFYEVRYRVKKKTDEHYIIAGDIKINRNLEDIDYIVEEMKRDGGYKQD